MPTDQWIPPALAAVAVKRVAAAAAARASERFMFGSPSSAHATNVLAGTTRHDPWRVDRVGRCVT
jgi:hypothetical protein